MVKVNIELVKAVLTAVILKLAYESPVHGYAVITHIRRRYGVYLAPSSVYPVLNKLKKWRMLRSEWDFSGAKPRKVYRLTNEGLMFMLSFSPEIRRAIQQTAVCPIQAES